MITLHWQHIILDQTVFSNYHTHRVARVLRAARLAGVSEPFPIVRRSPDAGRSLGTTWSPTSEADGEAPPSYWYNERNYLFGFWSIVIRRSGSRTEGSNPSPRVSPPVRTITGEDVTIEAKAWYVWDLADGEGGEGVYLDAFDIYSGEFIYDDFVDVSPDDRPFGAGTLTQAANNGLLSTDNIGAVEITARNPAFDSPYIQYAYLYWAAVGNAGIHTVAIPPAPGATLSVNKGDRLQAIAYYQRLPTENIPPAFIPREGWILIGNLADGPLFILGLGGLQPVGPFDPAQIKRLSEALLDFEKALRGRLQQ